MAVLPAAETGRLAAALGVVREVVEDFTDVDAAFADRLGVARPGALAAAGAGRVERAVLRRPGAVAAGFRMGVDADFAAPDFDRVTAVFGLCAVAWLRLFGEAFVAGFLLVISIPQRSIVGNDPDVLGSSMSMSVKRAASRAFDGQAPSFSMRVILQSFPTTAKHFSDRSGRYTRDTSTEEG